MNLLSRIPSAPSRFGAVLLTGLLATTLTQAEEHVTQRVFPVSGGGRLILQMDRGDIEIQVADTNAVGVTIVREVKRAGERRATEILENHQIELAQDGNVVRVKARPAKANLGSWWHGNLSVRCRVTVPREYHLDLETAGGSIEVPALKGMVEADTAGGSIRLGEIDGSVKANTAGGSITVAGATGPASIGTAGGHIKLGIMGGPVTAETSGGSIRIQSAAGPVRADTSGGSIDLGDMAGPVQAETSGGSITARFPKSSTGDVQLETSGGSISVFLGDDVRYQLDAECSGGRVSTDVPVTTQGKPDRSELHGQIGQGGQGVPKMVLRTSGGGIALKKWVASR